MASVQGLKNGTRIIRITVFARWGWWLKAQWIQRCVNTFDLIAFCSAVIAGHSRPKDGVAPLAYDPAIHLSS
jgi:hypothetical protein